MSADEKKGIKITAEDLASVTIQPPRIGSAPTADGKLKVYGSIHGEPTAAPDVPEQKGSIFLKAWVYLGIAGFFGAFIGWGISEPGFIDGGGSSRWGNVIIIPAVITLMCVFLSIAESIVERSVKRALMRGGLALLLGIVFGFVFETFAGIVFNIGLAIVQGMGLLNEHYPAFCVTRVFAWAVFGA